MLQLNVLQLLDESKEQVTEDNEFDVETDAVETDAIETSNKVDKLNIVKLLFIM